MKLLITSDHEMQDLGQILGTHAVAGNILLLTGDLGAGKTTLTKGIAKALGIKRPVKSPTYTIVREYKEVTLPLFHMDMYRLKDGDLSSIDLNDYFEQNGVIVIEWPEFVMDNLPADYLKINIARIDDTWDSTKRSLVLTSSGENSNIWLNKILPDIEK